MSMQHLRRAKYILLESLEARTLFDAVPMLDPALLELGNPEPALGVPAVDIYVNQDDGTTTAEAGESIIYAIEYGNDGTLDASGVMLSESLPTDATFDDANSSFGWNETAPDSGIYEYHLGGVFAGTSGSVKFAITINDVVSAGVDQIIGQVFIVDDGNHGADVNPADNSAADVDTLIAAPDLFVTQDGAVASAGETVTYTIHYGNAGSQAATGTVLRETLPTNSTADLSNSSFGWIETAPASGVYEFHVGSVSAGTSGIVSFALIINESVPAGVDHIVNSLSIADDGNNGADTTPGNNTDEEKVTISAAPDLAIVVSTTSTVASEGETILYSLTYSNDGTQDATGVVLREHLPDGTHFVTSGSTVGWMDVGSERFELAVGTVAVGETHLATFAVTVDDVKVAGGALTNTASIHDDGSNGPDLDATDNSFSVNTPTHVREPTTRLSAEQISLRHFLASSSQNTNDAAPSPQIDSVAESQSELSNAAVVESDDSTARTNGLSDRLSRWSGWLQRALNDDD